MDTPKSQKLEVIIPAFRMHSQNFINVLDTVSEEDALKRIEDKTNHIIWMAGNFINMRYGMAWVLGLREEDPYSDLFFQGKTLNTELKYPSLEALKKNFHHISPLVYQKLLEATDEDLDMMFPMGMNIDFCIENTLNFVGMCIGREDYLCGQLGLMRKLLGYEGMKYEIHPEIKY